jgi:alpha-tubulin suppressor-like RCC1 family protein
VESVEKRANRCEPLLDHIVRSCSKQHLTGLQVEDDSSVVGDQALMRDLVVQGNASLRLCAVYEVKGITERGVISERLAGRQVRETTENRAYCWGFGSGIGDGNTTSLALTPVAVTGGLYFRQVSAGDDYTCGNTAAAVAYCWGRNDLGQLGDGTTTQRTTPVAVVGSP